MKTTRVFGILMLVSVVLVMVCAVVNLSGIVAIFTGIIGTQESSGLSAISLFFGLIALAIFIFAYKRAIWNWFIRSSLITVGVFIFLISIAGLTENWNWQPGSPDGFSWRRDGEVIRTVDEAFLWIDFDVILFFMLLGSIGILSTAIWGAFRWEKAKSSERTQDQLQTVLNELPPTAFSPEADLRLELEQHFQSAPNPAASLQTPGAQPHQPFVGQGVASSQQSPPGSSQANNPPSPGSSVRRGRCPRCFHSVPPGEQVCPNCGAGG